MVSRQGNRTVLGFHCSWNLVDYESLAKRPKHACAGSGFLRAISSAPWALPPFQLHSLSHVWLLGLNQPG